MDEMIKSITTMQKTTCQAQLSKYHICSVVIKEINITNLWFDWVAAACAQSNWDPKKEINWWSFSHPFDYRLFRIQVVNSRHRLRFWLCSEAFQDKVYHCRCATNVTLKSVFSDRLQYIYIFRFAIFLDFVVFVNLHNNCSSVEVRE